MFEKKFASDYMMHPNIWSAVGVIYTKEEAGSVVYYAPGTEHDDGVMALLINYQKAKEYLKVGGQGQYVGNQIADTPEINYAMGRF